LVDRELDCMSCGSYNCDRRDKSYPEFCLTTKTDKDLIMYVQELYLNDPEVSKITSASADVEGNYYGKLTRVEEIILFAKKIGAQKIGIATCLGLVNEAKIFAKIVQAKGLKCFGVVCKVGSVDKTAIGIPEESKVKKGCFEATCNPILQAKLLEKEKTELNVLVGLCVGHDSLFIKYSHAPVTILLTKDRVLGHNPAAALYTSSFYYKRLLEQKDI